MKTKKEPVKASVTWQCESCAGKPNFDHPQFLEHIKTVHQIDPKVTKGKRSMTMHLDGADYFSSNYEWEIAGLKFLQFTINPRSKNDRMWH